MLYISSFFLVFIFSLSDWGVLFQITAAHICYLVAEANFESCSDSARLCLIGADHWKFPRTYASPEAIQVLSSVVLSFKITCEIEDFLLLHAVLVFFILHGFQSY